MKNGQTARICVPNPYFESDVNVYLLAGSPVTLIDTGIGTAEGFRALQEGLAQHRLTPADIELVAVTHKHPDHIGLAGRIQQESGARVLIHEDDYRDTVQVVDSARRITSRIRDRLQVWGVPAPEVKDVEAQVQKTGRLASPVECEPLHDGQRIERDGGPLEVIHTPGHTRGSVCLRWRDAIFTGDHVLPGYTPNVGAGEADQKGLLQSFTASLRRIRDEVNGVRRFYPGHGARMPDLRARVSFILKHHLERRKGIRRAVEKAGSATVYQLARELFGRLDSIHVWLGTAEVAAHLLAMQDDGEICWEGQEVRLCPDQDPATRRS